MAKKENKPSNAKRVMIFWLLIFVPVFLFFLIMWGAKTGNLGFDELPDLAELEKPKSNLASEIITSDGKTIRKYFLQNRTNVKFEDLSPFLVEALIATEDERYRSHSGIDLRGLVRAVANLGQAGGASTITQQLAKMMFDHKAKNLIERIKQKLQEQILAVELEKRYTKDEIITMYYNQFDFIYNAVGIKSAARVYFNKTPIELDIEEAAVLVGMAKNPSLYNPKRFPENAMKRREVVFAQMKRSELITQEEYDSLRVLPIELNYQVVDHREGVAPYFRETLRLKIQKMFKEKDADSNYIYAKSDGEPYNIYRDGLKIFTTINSRMQKHAEFAVEEYIAKSLQKLFDKRLKKVRTIRYPYDGHPRRGISQKQYLSLLKSAKEKTPRYRILVGKECFNCGRRGSKNVHKVGNYFVCKNNDCGEKIWATNKDSIDIIFDKKIKMKLFSHNGDIDTLLSPNDSIKYYKTFLHTGLMSVDPHTGYIKAWVGGVNYDHFAYDHVTSTRQVGSTFKPFVYVTAIQNGYSPCYEVPNVKTTFHKGEFGLLKDWTPSNSGGPDNGCLVSLKYAIANSMNTTTAWVMKQFGPQAVIEQARNMGIKNKLDPVPSLCLGVADLSVYEMVGANATFANKGVYIEPTMFTRIEDKHGNVIMDVNPETKEAMSEESAYVMLDLMKGVTSGEYNECMGDDRVARGKSGQYKNGTGLRLRNAITERRPYGGHNYPIAGKTGTTQDNSDGWFMGITPDLVTGVWVGADERAIRFEKTDYGQGANMALPVWAYYMQKVKADKELNYPNKDFDRPEKPLTVELDCIKYNLMKNGGDDFGSDY